MLPRIAAGQIHQRRQHVHEVARIVPQLVAASLIPFGQCTISGDAMPPSLTHDLCSRSGVFEQVDHPGPSPRNDRAEPGGAARSWPSPRINCSELAPLSERNRITVSRSAPMAFS